MSYSHSRRRAKSQRRVIASAGIEPKGGVGGSAMLREAHRGRPLIRRPSAKPSTHHGAIQQGWIVREFTFVRWHLSAPPKLFHELEGALAPCWIPAYRSEARVSITSRSNAVCAFGHTGYRTFRAHR